MKTLKWIEANLEKMIMMILLTAFSTVMIVQVAMRYVFNNPFLWAEEFCRYTFVATVAFGSAYCVRNNVMLKVDIIIDLFPEPVKRVFVNLMWLAMIFVYSVLAIRGYPVARDGLTGGTKSAAMGISIGVLYSMMEAGFILTVIRAAEMMIIGIIQNNRDRRKGGE